MTERFKVHSIGEILTFPSPQWRIRDLLSVGGFSMMFASHAQGKTFMALDIALCVASGREFHGRAVLQGPVLYVLGEGRSGLKNRVSAWLNEHGLKDVPDAFFVLEGVQFHKPQDVSDVKLRIDHMPVKPQMVVIDTFARCAVGVEENDATGMGQWVDAIGRLQQELCVDVLVLHHSQKQNSQRERGSSSFIGAVDTAMSLKLSGRTITVECKKQKDAEEFDTFKLQMKTVEVGINEFGEPVHSCVLVKGGVDGANVSRNCQKMLVALAALGGEAARLEWLQKAGVPERTFDRSRGELETLKHIEDAGTRGRYRLTETGKGILSLSDPSSPLLAEAA